MLQFHEKNLGGGPGEYQDGGNRSSTKPRMRARVQGLEEGSDSDDGDIEVVDFTDGNLRRIFFIINNSSEISVISLFIY